MTIEEKVQALSTNPTIPRLGIVGTQHVEGLHGLALGGPAGWEGKNLPVIPTTQFPQSRGLGQTWDPALIQKAAAAEGYETRYAYGKYHRGGMVVRAPNADLSRDPRWGRSEESYGEDPFLVGTMATAFTRGLQGDDPHMWLTSSLLKHFLANSNEDGRDGSSSNFDERLFREYYSVPFRMAIQQGGANAMMTAYNGWNGVPMIENPILRATVIKEWGFDGIICTDGGALTNVVTHHHAFKTMSEAAAAAIHAGINQFLDDYRQPVMDALEQNLITEQEIDGNIRGVFRVMLRLGMLDPAEQIPYAKIGTVDQAKGDPWNWPERHALVRQVTDESIVLLKNDHNILPLHAEITKNIAVIGPLADRVALDWYSGTPPYVVTPLAGIRTRAGSSSSVTFSKGDDANEAAALAAKADVAIVIVGNHPTCDAGWFKCALPSEGKEAIDRKSLALEQEELVKAVYAANPKTVVVLQTSFPYTTNWSQEHIPAILQITHNSEEQGNALADALFGDYNPAGRLTQTWVSSIDQLPAMMDYDLRHGRTYLYLKQKPLYAFGFGLSYTTFAYSNLHVSTSSLAPSGNLTVTADIRNTGARDGDEVVQLYVAYPHSAVARPIEELKGFERTHLRAGESKTVTLHLPAQSLGYWNDMQHDFVVEPGPIELRIGASSNDIKLSKTVIVAR
ncbi:glycoside hydrolase family 3 C-terminal domain-containing protein [Tunturibacter empetritectus]|uniref:Beta-glucosidase n=1 Tax=Tunturiibacter lichenicola TaxID=2051959 RepID=A0A7W8J9E2_9BACT|nr:glycoside hydrolase family 3 C-terminal domain-containing protein [Edaphobacter lichenicola]MBB5345069.1 beta-glucosidase [Edaphobacter lichenicola]